MFRGTLCKTVAVATLTAGCLAAAAPAFADQPARPGAPAVVLTYPPEPTSPPPVPTPEPGPPEKELPFTGAQVLGMAAAGGALGVAGVLLLVASRRRHRTGSE